jgi:hypothetical protein
MIASKDIPAYKDGGTTEGGLLVAGEEGQELYRMPGGKWGITPDSSTLMSLPAGTEIFDNKESMRMLALLAAGSVDSTMPVKEDGWRTVGDKLDNLNNTIKNKHDVHINYSKEGAEAALVNTYEKIKFKKSFLG